MNKYEYLYGLVGLGEQVAVGGPFHSQIRNGVLGICLLVILRTTQPSVCFIQHTETNTQVMSDSGTPLKSIASNSPNAVDSTCIQTIDNMFDDEEDTDTSLPLSAASTIVPVKKAKPHQQDAIDEVVRRFVHEGARGTALVGGTGSGKTLCGSIICKLISNHLGNEGVFKAGVPILTVVPPMGATVTDQFMREWDSLQMKSMAFDYHGGDRDKKLKEWRKLVALADPGHPCFLITSTQLLHADVRKIQLSNPGMPIEEARKRMAKELGEFAIVLWDEFQEGRNGGAPTDEKRDYDPSKAFYGAIDTIVKHCSSKGALKFVLGLSATPCVNGSGDLYSFLRFFWAGQKLSIMNSTRRSNDPGQKNTFRQASKMILRRYVVKIAEQPVPETTRCEISHFVDTAEFTMIKENMSHLAVRAATFLNALAKYRENPFHDEQSRIAAEVAKTRYLSAYTKCRRGMTHVYFYQPTKRADPAVRPMKDSKGNIVMANNDAGVKVPIGMPLKIDAKAVANEYPPGTKFESIISYLAEITEERVLIQFAYSGACDLLAEYIRRRLPEREIYMYHGDIPSRATQMKKFQLGAINAILIATRGACEKAVDVHATTKRMVYNPSLGYATPIRFSVRQIFGDVALSYSEQQQAEGRTKRTLAQGWDSEPDKVQEWICAESTGYTPDEFPTIETFMRKVVDLKKARCDDVFRTEEDDLESGSENANSGVSKRPSDEEKGVLSTLIELMAPYMKKDSKATKPDVGGKRRAVFSNASGKHRKLV